MKRTTLETAFVWTAEAHDAAWEAVLAEPKLTLVRQRLSVDSLRTIIRAVLHAVEPEVRDALRYNADPRNSVIRAPQQNSLTPESGEIG